MKSILEQALDWVDLVIHSKPSKVFNVALFVIFALLVFTVGVL